MAYSHQLSLSAGEVMHAVRLRPWWMGPPVVWLWMTAAAAQVAPLSVTLHAEAPCPVPEVVTPLLRLPTGCPAPWAGVLYTEAHHADLRARVAQVDALAVAHRGRADVAERSLLACRTQRDEVTAQCVRGVSRLEGHIAALADLQASPVERPALWPWAALSGALSTVGAGVGALAGRGAGEVIGYGLAGAAVGTVVGAMVERFGR